MAISEALLSSAVQTQGDPSVRAASEHGQSVLGAIMDNAIDPIYVRDDQGVFVAANRAYAGLVGEADPKYLIGRRAEDVLGPELHLPSARLDAQVLLSGTPLHNHEERVLAADGTLRWMLANRTPLEPQPGSSKRAVLCIMRDITPRMRYEQALLASEERFRLVLEHTRDIAYRVNLPSETFDYVSPSVARLLGYTAEEIMVMRVDDFMALVHPDDAEAIPAYQQILVTATPSSTTEHFSEYRLRHRDGSYRWFSENAMVVYDAQGAPVARVGTLRDITYQKRTEHALRMASRMEATSTLAGGIAHDFNNLMSVVLANAELLHMLVPGDPDARSMLRAIALAAEEGGTLAQQMLAFARGGKYQPAALNLNDVLHETVLDAPHDASTAVEVRLDLEPDLWNVLADADQLQQAVKNLWTNAVESVTGKGQVLIETSNADVTQSFAKLHPGLKSGRYVSFTVSDNGAGMDAEVQARVFEPFFSTKFQGRGLGLSAVYGIVKNHGGYICLDSALGRGTSVHIFLPAAQGEPAKKPAASEKLPCGSETVLVVDDELPVLEATVRILEHLGYKTMVANDGQEALALAEDPAVRIDAVLLDMAMPVMGGAETFPRLRAMRPNLKVLICSGYELSPAAQDVLNAGASAFLQKPYRVSTLAAELRRVLDN